MSARVVPSNETETRQEEAASKIAAAMIAKWEQDAANSRQFVKVFTKLRSAFLKDGSLDEYETGAVVGGVEMTVTYNPWKVEAFTIRANGKTVTVPVEEKLRQGYLALAIFD